MYNKCGLISGVLQQMRTSSANNSVFRGFFEKQKLTGPNFIDWYRQLRIVLSIENKLNYLKQPIPPALVAPEGHMRKTVNELHAMPKLHKQTLPKNNAPALHVIRAGKVQKVNKQKKPQPQMTARRQNQRKGKNKLAYDPKPKIPPPPKKKDTTKDSICHECGETGHWKRNCPQYLSELLKKKNAIPKDGIFEIDLSNSYANDTSMYDVSNKRAKLDLDSALLWHCRLGHISKKRIEKLQYDGLLNSIDLRTFEKCVSCMSGKMAKKPYTHQVKRAKDLLGLIHTNVCDPFKIMSRQGASYFVTFTDDFSRYGYVYLLKHKHEVFETFKVFQTKVENQLDIRAIRILIAIAAYYDYGIWQIDVKTSFLNGYLSEEVYMEQPEGASTPAELKRMQNVLYASVVGSIMNTKDMFLVYGGDIKRELRVSCYTDTGYLTDADDFKSQTGYVFVLNGGDVDWKSAKQSIFATSPAEVEYIVAFDASKEAVWVRKFIYGLGVVSTIKEPISMYYDYTGVITIANESGITKGARHFHAKVHYLHEVIEYGDVKLEKVHTYDNLADPFTKALAFPMHSKHTKNIKMLTANSLM
nr:retrotransposon protein, putative, Ty1-copia subclass [Tanacetum cinerariifolium]